jgi:hypothetical protein
MIALRLVRLIEKHSDELARGLMRRLTGRKDLEGLERIPPEELLRRAHEVYRNLGDWLLERSVADVASRYAEIGARRAQQGVPLSTVLAAISEVKDRLWRFLKAEQVADTPLEIYGELELLERVDHFFDLAIFHAARGYELARREHAA